MSFSSLQCQNRLNLKFEKNSYDILVIHMFVCDKGMTIPQITLGFFQVFNQSVWPFSGLILALFGFLLKFSSGNSGAGCKTCERMFYCWYLLCNNNMAANLRFTSSYNIGVLPHATAERSTHAVRRHLGR